MARDPSLDRSIMQWSDLSAPGRRVVSDNLRAAGANMPQRVSEQIEQKRGSSDRKAPQQQKALEAIQPHVKSRPVTLQRAANSRQRLYQDAQARQTHPDQAVPQGADWYFEHHARVARSAREFGFPEAAAHTASAGMSPQNSPENERAAVHAIMDAHRNGKVEVTQQVSDHLAKKGIDVAEHIGSTKSFSELPVGTVSHLSSTEIRDQVNTSADLKNVARAGIKENAVKAERVLLGQTPGDEAFVNKNEAITSSKVASYDRVIREAKPGTAEHVEFMGRVHQDALVRRGQISKDQQALPLYDKDVPERSILSPSSHTVEDTWQNAITFDQPKELEGKTSVFKAGGSDSQYPVRGLKTKRDEEGKRTGSAHPDPRVTDNMVLHAFNNRATQKAAMQQGVPPVAMQGVAWTEARKQAGKSRDVSKSSEAHKGEMSNAQYQAEVEVHRAMARPVPQHVRELQEQHKPKADKPEVPKGQGVLF